MIRRVVILFVMVTFLMVACSTPSAVPEPTLVRVTPLATETAVPPTSVPPTSVPPTAVPPTAEPPTQPAPTEPADVSLNERMDAFLQSEANADRLSGAVLVARGDEIILSKGYGFADRDLGIPNLPTTRFRIASMTKAFTAMAIMQLQEQGKLDVHNSVCDYVSDCPTMWAPVTLHHLMTHTAGIPHDDELTTALAREGTPEAPAVIELPVDDEPLLFEPGSDWAYSNMGYNILTLIIEQVSGQSYEIFLQENIFTPLQMADTGYDHNRDDLAIGYTNQFGVAPTIDMAVPSGAGALYSTVEDLLRWARALYNAELVSAETMEQIFASQEPIVGDTLGSYGYGWFVGSLNEHPVANHGGLITGYHSDFLLYPEDELTAIVLMNRQDNVPYPFTQILSKWVLEDE